MLVPTPDRIKVFEYLFKEGVIVASSDAQLKSHPQITGVRNLYVITLMNAFTTKGFVNKNYAWQHHYYYITNEGIEYLRELLHLPPAIVPVTLKRTTRDSSLIKEDRSAGRGRGGRGGARGGRGGRGGTRGGSRGGAGYRS